jgi:hypothetical protein
MPLFDIDQQNNKNVYLRILVLCLFCQKKFIVLFSK